MCTTPKKLISKKQKDKKIENYFVLGSGRHWVQAERRRFVDKRSGWSGATWYTVQSMGDVLRRVYYVCKKTQMNTGTRDCK